MRLVRRSLDQLRGVLDDPLFIVRSDNGAVTYFTDDGDPAKHKPNGDWRGQKGDLWDGGHRELFIARLPGTLPAGERALAEPDGRCAGSPR